jgi:hypothetical protein
LDNAVLKRTGPIGCSDGFGLRNTPEFFAAASPHIPWDNEVLYKYEQEFVKKRLPHPLRVYMTVGDVELTRPAFEKFSSTMMARKYPSVRLHSKILENTGHGGTKNETYARGLQYVFERPKLNLAASVLNSYAGTYQLPDGRQLKNEDGQLALYFGSNRIFTLYAASERIFTRPQNLQISILKMRRRQPLFQIPDRLVQVRHVAQQLLELKSQTNIFIHAVKAFTFERRQSIIWVTGVVGVTGISSILKRFTSLSLPRS